jgi:ferredoxin-NADP reductase
MVMRFRPRMNPLRLPRIGLCVAVVLLGAAPAVVWAQVSAEEHASHHPDQAAEADSSPGAQSGPPAGAGGMGGGMMGGGEGGGMGGGMGKMMEQMGAPKPRQLYPSLMALPDLPPERRQQVEREAHERMKAGTVLMSDGLEALSRAAPSDDYAAMQEASETLREGLSQFDSGLAAHRALAEGRAPRSVALEWFKREMSLLPPGAPGRAASGGLFGLSWFHFTIMLILVAFAVAMIAMYFFKMRRASALLARIAAPPETPPEGSPEVSPKAPPESSPPATANTTTEALPGAGSLPAAATVTRDCCDDGDGECATERSDSAATISQGLLPVLEKKLCRLRVARIVQETPDVKTFRFVSCHGGGIPFSFLPGQFLTLTLPVGEKPIKRSYTISSSPTQGYYCEITVKREEQGAGSRYLHDRMKVGDTIEVRAPNGRFTFVGKEAGSVVLIGGGVGITPMMSIARALTDMAWSGDIYFIAACQDPEHFIFEEELKRLDAEYDNLHLFVAMSRIEQDMNGYRRGRLSKELLTQWVPDIGSKWVHLCGAPHMMDAVKGMLAELGVPGERIHTESFGSTQKPKAKVAEGQEAAAAKSKAAQVGTVTFAASDVSTPFEPDETVLEASERVDVNIDYSCRVGTCGECKVKLLSGEVSMEVEDGLDPGEKEQGMILACQAKSTSDVSVDA